jgi:hypothetical protein
MTKTLSICAALVLLAGCDRTYPGQQTARAATVAAACADAGGRSRYTDSWAYPGSLQVECVIAKGTEQ